ncbi:hypothetical protein STCU_12306 [Strigomonas culicis]|uniref:Uncharacterized protein n=1 Tax=Strigomonas culicis TaxID=28005 RepID=S9UXA9_9TRYP|nr:hypothetical protein STCU_12306 [Strigomonas culicis]|eukprot:EPY15155.1 hypothetical protein STCU_12306 [Strigomonas culicis]
MNNWKETEGRGKRREDTHRIIQKCLSPSLSGGHYRIPIIDSSLCGCCGHTSFAGGGCLLREPQPLRIPAGVGQHGGHHVRAVLLLRRRVFTQHRLHARGCQEVRRRRGRAGRGPDELRKAGVLLFDDDARPGGDGRIARVRRSRLRAADPEVLLRPHDVALGHVVQQRRQAEAGHRHARAQQHRVRPLEELRQRLRRLLRE